MGMLKNKKHELFAELKAKGKTSVQAALECGYAGITGDTLNSRPDVKRRIAELGETAVAAAMNLVAISKANVIEGLWLMAQDREISDSARVRAFELCGIEMRMFQRESNVKVSFPKDLSQATDEELEAFQEMILGPDEAMRKRLLRRLERGGMVIEGKVEGPEPELRGDECGQ